MQLTLPQIFQILKLSPETEYRFHPVRRWRFDYAFPDEMIAIEYEGIFRGKSRHRTVSGYTKDCEKYNTAALLGWTVLRFTAVHLKDGTAFEMIQQAIDNVKNGACGV